MFAHGFNIHFGAIQPPADVDVSMVAPKSPGHRVRELYQSGAGVPALFAVHQDATGHAKADALAYARGIGCTRAGVLETTFREETETDLFGEQAVLCGGVSALVKAGFETLTEAGYKPELAYFECLHELKLIVDLMYQGGLNYMRHSVSDTAEYGDYVAGPQIITDETRATMRTLLTNIQDGTFARNWIAENETGRTNFDCARKKDIDHPIEQVGRDMLGVDRLLQVIRDEDHDHVRFPGRVGDAGDPQPRRFGLGTTGRRRREPYAHVEPGVAEVEGVGVPLRAEADDGDPARRELVEGGVGVVVESGHVGEDRKVRAKRAPQRTLGSSAVRKAKFSIEQSDQGFARAQPTSFTRASPRSSSDLRRFLVGEAVGLRLEGVRGRRG